MANMWKIASVIMSIVIVAIVLLFIKQKDNFSQTKNDNPPYVSDSLVAYKSFFDLNLTYSGQKIDDITCFFDDSEILLSQLIKDKPVLILMYSNNNCSACLEDLLNRIYGNVNKMLILCSDISEKEFELLTRDMNIKYPIYIVDDTNFGWAPDTSNQPYMFVINKNLTISDLFIPDNRFQNVTTKYLDAIDSKIR